MTFFLVHINYFAVLLSAVAAMAIGFVWYGPLFGQEWMKLMGISMAKMKAGQKEMGNAYGIMFVMALIMAYVFAHFVWYAAPGSLTLFISVKTAVWAWLGFVLVTLVNGFLTMGDKKPLKLLIINAGYYLVSLMVMGVIFDLLR